MYNDAAASLKFKIAFIADFTQVLVGVITDLNERERFCFCVSCVLGKRTVLLVNCIFRPL